MRTRDNWAWTGDADTVIVWNGYMRPVGDLKPNTEFELFGWKWKVRRQAGRTTFADGIGEWDGCRIQIKHYRLVEVPYIVHAEQNTESEPK